MDIFKFGPISDTSTDFLNGTIINGFTSKMWIERYAAAGEFTLVAPVSTGVKEQLPVGSLISHVDSREVMIVENHEINEQKGEETKIKITGRGLETFMENRIVGSNQNYPIQFGVDDYTLPAYFTWNQIVFLIVGHIEQANLIDKNNAVRGIHVTTDIIDTTGETVPRQLKRKDLYSSVLDLLPIDKLGIKILRPGPWSPLGAQTGQVVMLIHKGVDRTQSIVFSHDTGEIETADYLWSVKKLKNAALVSGRWCETFIPGTSTGYDRRVMWVDARDIDENYETVPTDAQANTILSAMYQRGIQALAAQEYISLTKAEVSKQVIKAGYRSDFEVGDLITVVGDYEVNTTRRISEYVEIEDETGVSAYPTLTTI